jgi:hypothetical protein
VYVGPVCVLETPALNVAECCVFSLLLLYPLGKYTVTHWIGGLWKPDLVWTRWRRESYMSLQRIELVHLVCSHSLYGLSYGSCASFYVYKKVYKPINFLIFLEISLFYFNSKVHLTLSISHWTLSSTSLSQFTFENIFSYDRFY